MNQAQRQEAATKLCELRGVDPYETSFHGADSIDSAVHPLQLHSHEWRKALREIVQMDYLMTAMEYGRSLDI